MPVLAFAGDDLYSITEAVGSVIRDGDFEDFDLERVSAASMAPQAVLMTVGTAGLFAERRLIVIEGMGQERKAARGKAKAQDEDGSLTLDRLAAATPESTTVITLLTGLRSDSALLKEATTLARAK